MATKPDDDIDDSLLDKNLADIEDLPSFEVPPKGAYRMLVSMGTKRVNDKPAAYADLEVIEVIQLANTADKEPKIGDKTGVLFFLDNDFGLGNMKKFLAPFAAHFQTENVKELIRDKVQNVEMFCTMDHQVDKEDKSKIYARPKNISIA